MNIDMLMVPYKALLLIQLVICSISLLNSGIIILLFKVIQSLLVDLQLLQPDNQFYLFWWNIANQTLYVYFNIYDKDLLLIIHNKTCQYKIVLFFIAVYINQPNTIFCILKQFYNIISTFFLKANK